MNTSVPIPRASARKRWAIAAVIAALVAAMLTAGGAAASAMADSTASVSGTVLEAGAAGTGIANAYVQLYTPGTQYVAGTTTDTNGNYSFSGLASGSYTLDFQSPSGGNFVEQWWNNEPNNFAANYFTLADGQALAVNASLAVGATLSGSIDGAGSTSVPLDLAGAELQSTDGSSFAFGSTNSSGDYTITGIAAGTYTLSFNPPFNSGNYLPQWWNDQPTQATAQSVTITAAQTLTGYNAVLAVGASISGHVTGADTGQGLPSANVEAIQGGNTEGFANVASDGSYTLSGLTPGAYTLLFSPANGTNYVAQYWNDAPTAATATTVNVAGGDVDTGYDAALVVGATVSGTITTVDAPGTGLANASAIAVDSSDNYVTGATTDAKGNYSIVGLAPGTYRIEFDAPTGDNHASQFWKNAVTFNKATPVTVSGTTTTSGINASLGIGATISGTVVDTTPAAAPIGSTDVIALTPGGAEVDLTLTDENGNYTLTNLPAGTYVVEFAGSDGGAYTPSWWQNASSRSSATRITVSTGASITGINGSMAPAYLTPGHPTITGSAKVGSTLTAHPGTWKPSGATFTYQWNRDGTAIAAATGATYVPVNADAGHTLSVSVTGDRYNFNDVTVTSPSTKVVTGGILASPVPQIVGTPTRGATLSVVTGSWGPGTVALTYHWSRAGSKIAGATNATYTVTKADAGKAITVSVTGAETDFTTTTETSAPTTPAS